MTKADAIILVGTLVAAIAVCLVAIAIDNRHAQKVCEQSFSRSTCVYTLR